MTPSSECLRCTRMRGSSPSAGGVTLTVNSAMLGLVPGGSMGIAASS